MANERMYFHESFGGGVIHIDRNSYLDQGKISQVKGSQINDSLLKAEVGLMILMRLISKHFTGINIEFGKFVII